MWKVEDDVGSLNANVYVSSWSSQPDDAVLMLLKGQAMRKMGGCAGLAVV